ncbi:unnamed protein product [Heterobilharzia americana]|nr:unnamed protein product [Heterobilharzia americana]
MYVPTIPAHLRTRLVSHGQRVCQLYKAVLYDVKAKHSSVLKYRYYAVLARARFEENRNVKDPMLARKLLEDGWEELKLTATPWTFTYPNSPLGAAYGRETYFNDCSYDAWHPLEKQQYPDFFAKREKNKEEFMKDWVKRYGPIEE